MIIKIEIECDSIMEFFQHMRVIRVEARRLMTKQKLSSDKEFPPTEWDDDNCYGRHDVVISEDEMLKDHLPPSGLFAPSY